MTKVKNRSCCIISCIIEKVVSLESICFLVLSWLFMREMSRMVRSVFEEGRSL